MKRFAGIPIRVMLVSALVSVIALVTGGSLLIVQDRVHRQTAQNLSTDLQHSLATFENLQRLRRDALIHENALLADLPSLKALMTTHDQRTIADGALEFWQVSDSDLFALAEPDGRVVSVNTRGAAPSPTMPGALQQLIVDPRKHYLVCGSRLFDIAVRPLFFGSDTNGTLLGYVISGYAINRGFVDVISKVSAAQASFLAGGRPISSTLSLLRQQQLESRQPALAPGRHGPTVITLGGEEYLATQVDLSGEATIPLQLAILKSMAVSNRAKREINRLVALLGLSALLLGTMLMLALSRIVTRPLELLAQGVRAFGVGDPIHLLPANGTREVRELTEAFARMRREILRTSRALLESEKLATIGRMANSISHDFRHYLAAIYANAEFLSSPQLPEAEREELFADIQAAVHGTTELIDSLLIFSRDGARLRRARESAIAIAERAVSLLRAHPAAEGVVIEVSCAAPGDCDAMVDAKKLERALYNLLLNACQSAQKSTARQVQIDLASTPETLIATVTDSGAGVPEAIRGSLFEPFASQGKQSGTGLGLTLAHAIAEEHGGTVTLVSTRPGEVIFQLSLERNLPGGPAPGAQAPGSARSQSAERLQPRRRRGKSPSIRHTSRSQQVPGRAHRSQFAAGRLLAVAASLGFIATAGAQSPAPTADALAQQVARLAAAVTRQQQQLQQSQAQIAALQQQVAAFQAQLGAKAGIADEMTGGQAAQAASALAQQVQALREQQEIEHTELATQQQTKVETESKYPLTISGLILANAFTNTAGVDVIQAPTQAEGGVGATGFSLRQTVLGLDARGPHLFGASTQADVRLDFFGGSPSTATAGSYGGYDLGGLARLRTAHFIADWAHASAFAQLDRVVLSPDTPTSLTAVAQPALAWSGNLWTWIPQLGGAYRWSLHPGSSLTAQAALLDVPDAPAFDSANAGSLAEQSRWPGSEARLAYAHGDPLTGFRVGAGGYFSPHASPGVFHYDAWAATLDYRIPLSRYLEANGAFYRGLALGGLGGGAYKDFVSFVSPSGQSVYVRPLDAAGGWSQLKLRAGERLEFNADYGLDNAFSSELRPYAAPAGGVYSNLVRNSTFFTNAIYSPTAYTLFSFEYRRLDSTPVTGSAFTADVFGLAAGYKF